MEQQQYRKIAKIPLLGDRWPFILAAVILAVLVISTAKFPVGGAVSGEYQIERARIITTNDSQLSPEPSIQGMRIGKQIVTLQLLTGAYQGQQFKVENVMSRGFNIDCRPGRTIIANVREEGGAVAGIDVFGYDRQSMIYGLLALFFAVLVIIGRKKGLYSAISLAFTLIVIVFYMLPGILQGKSPVLLAIITAILTAAITIFICSGWNAKSFAAIAGIFCGVAAAGVIAAVAGKLGNLSGIHMQESGEVLYLAQELPIHVPQLLTAGIIISALGAIMDIAITISSAIVEVKTANPKMKKEELYKSGMNVGKDAMGTMSNTLILAFAGSSLNVLLIIMLYNLPYLRMINIDLLSIELLQGLAGSIGLVLTVPLTALCAAVLSDVKGGKFSLKED